MKKEEFYKRESTYLKDIRMYNDRINDYKIEILKLENRIKYAEISIEITMKELEEFKKNKENQCSLKNT